MADDGRVDDGHGDSQDRLGQSNCRSEIRYVPGTLRRDVATRETAINPHQLTASLSRRRREVAPSRTRGTRSSSPRSFPEAVDSATCEGKRDEDNREESLFLSRVST